MATTKQAVATDGSAPERGDVPAAADRDIGLAMYWMMVACRRFETRAQ